MIDPRIRIDIEKAVGEFVREKRWYGSKGRKIQRVELEHFSSLPEGLFLCVCNFFYEDGSIEKYFVPFSLRGSGNSFISTNLDGKEMKLYDATDDPEFSLLITRMIMDQQVPPNNSDVLRIEKTSFSSNEVLIGDKVRKLTGEQSNTSIVIEDRFILKIYRKIIGTENPDYKIPVILWQEAGFGQTPMPIGKAELFVGHSLLIATLSLYLNGSTDGWSRFTSALESGLRLDAQMKEMLLLDDAGKLGSLTGSLHSALKVISTNNVLSFHEYARGRMIPGIQGNLEEIKHFFSINIDSLPDNIRIKIQNFLDFMPEHLERLYAIADKFQDQSLMVVHGDYHLGQVLFHDGLYYVIDFEGEPMRDTTGNFITSLPHKDIAGMIRSFDYALSYSLKATGKVAPQEFHIAWLNNMMKQFIRSYTENSGIIVDIGLLDLFLAEKAIYELKYELFNRPGWIDIPLTFLERL